MPAVKDVIVGFPEYSNRPYMPTIVEIVKGIQHPDCVIRSIIPSIGDSLVTRARNRVVKHFLDLPPDQAQYLMFIDSDIGFDWQMINRLRAHKRPIIAGTYLKKGLPYRPVHNSLLSVDQTTGLYHYREVGTGFLMIHRSVFGAMKEAFPGIEYDASPSEPQGPYWDFFQVGVVDRVYLSEDYFFCQNALQLGFKTEVDPQVIVQHFGQAVYPMDPHKLIEGAAQYLAQDMPPGLQLNADHLRLLRDAADRLLLASAEASKMAAPVDISPANLQLVKNGTQEAHADTPAY